MTANYRDPFLHASIDRTGLILFNYSGHGLMDLAGYQSYFADELHSYPLPPEVLERSLAVMEGHPRPMGIS